MQQLVTLYFVTGAKGVNLVLLKFYRTRTGNKDLRTEEKHIVFLSKLLLLFQFCHSRKTENPLVETRAVGTMVSVRTTCQNPRCTNKETVWNSQPTMPGTKIPAGNFLLCFAILLAGGSASKVFSIFAHMGLACVSLATYFEHQRVSKLKIGNSPYGFPF